MKMTYRVDPALSGLCVRDFLRREAKLSASLYKAAKTAGGFFVNDRPALPHTPLAAGDILTVFLPLDTPSAIEPVDLPLEVLYEDDDLLAVNKPAGMPVHPSFRHHTDTLANAVCYRYRASPFTFRVLTRLDGDTTGVVLIARNALAASAFDHASAVKTYYAVTDGVPHPLCGVVDLPLARDEGVIKRRISPDGKPAVTRYETLGEKDGRALVKCVPVTGRTHQIRVHLSAIGCPITGDFLYGKEIAGERTRLHCFCVAFKHPLSGKTLTVTAPLPPDMKSPAFPNDP